MYARPTSAFLSGYTRPGRWPVCSTGLEQAAAVRNRRWPIYPWSSRPIRA